ncbi:hypothetical protein E4T43_05924 [Aureobasidium subglaciale]|nr:hypothetical protein E4T43_05924 [Aureobasidium subglaciale]
MVSQKKPSGAARSARGGIAKRKTRTDRDGDLVMDPTARTRGGGVAKGGKSGAPAGRDKTRGAKVNPRGAGFEKKLANHIGGSTVRTRNQPSRGLEELRVTGYKNSKAASNSDGGLNSLIVWLEKRASLKSKRAIKIKKVQTSTLAHFTRPTSPGSSRAEGDDVLVSVSAEDAVYVLRVDGFVFAGTNIKIERASAQDLDTGVSKESTIAMLKGVLARRYNVEIKLLDLSALGVDPDLKAAQIFDSSSTTGKFFPALMKVLDQQFKNAAEKHEAITSVSLANNQLTSVAPVTTLAQTLPQLINLDLSNNAFKDLTGIEAWRRKFPKLDHLIVSGNPLEQAEPDYAAKLMAWYPKLRLLNTLQVRSDQEAEKGRRVIDMPFPIKGPNFQDEGQIAENFLRTFFAGYDTDRAALAQHYYDEQSDFSFSVNTAAPRDPTKSHDTAPQEWDFYIKRSRNLKKITQLPARQSRLCRGAQAVHESWSALPATRHPDLATQPQKWLIECQSQPGVPDPTGASPVGVDGFLITIHGEFDELDVSTGQVKKIRSFDRTFILGPGGPAGVRVVNDMLTIRAYGGFAAFEPEQIEPQAQAEAGVPVLPPGLTPEIAEQMIIELQKQTSMTVQYAKDCLEQVQWDFDRALQAFAAVRANLPADAFVQAA